MLQLHTFGSCLLTRDGARVDALSGQRKALALLALLAAAGEHGVSRDTLLGHLWPESDDEHARTSLKQLVRSLRSRLHAPEVLLGSAELRLNPNLVTSDVAEFRAALTRADHEAAAALYAGPFLDGFFLKGADPFERWVATERAALAQDFARVLEVLAERASANGNGRAAVESWRRLAAADPLNARAAMGLMRALDVAGERAVALHHARVYEQLLRDELDAAPEPALTALVERLRQAEPTGPTNGVHTGSVPARLALAQASAAARVEPVVPNEAVGGGPVASRSTLARAVAVYVAAFAAIALLGQGAVVGFGLPDWVFPGALIIAASGLPVILVTAFVQRMPNAVPEAANTSGHVRPAGGGATPVSAPAAFAARVRRHLTWRRAAWGGVIAVGAFAIFVAGFMISRALGIGPAASMLAAGTLDRSGALLVADFDIHGGADPSLGSTLAEAVRIDLGQSKVVTIVPATAIGAALQRMQRPPGASLSRAVARELAEREGIKAVVEGELTPLRDDFVVTIRLVSAFGDELVSFQETTDQTGVIRAIGRLTRRLRAKIGESLKHVRASPPLQQVTTPSLAALRKYTDGLRAMPEDHMRPIRLLKEAVALDSTFAMAWTALAIAYSNARMPHLLSNASERAYRFRDRLPDRERYRAVGNYFGSGPGRDRARALEATEAGMRLDSIGFANTLGLLYMERRDYARAVQVFRLAIHRVTGEATFRPTTNLAQALYLLGKGEESESIAVEVRRRFPNLAGRTFEADYLYNRGQLDSAQQQLERDRAEGTETVRRNASGSLTALHKVRGRLAEAQRAWREAEEANLARDGVQPDALASELWDANLDILHRDRPERGLRRMEQALERNPLASLPLVSPSSGETYYIVVARMYAQARQPDRARAVLAQFEADVRDTGLVRASAPAIHAVRGEIALAEERPLVAVEEFRLADRLPDGPATWYAIGHYADMGRAFDEADMADSAIATFERYIDTPQLTRLAWDATYLAGILRRLGALYEAKGDRTKAIEYHERFVRLWRSADPELQPRVAEVRRRIESLRENGRD
jgi:DNA-binding SARP family transcriptional activator